MPDAEPVTTAGPEEGSSASDGGWTVNVAEEKSFVNPVAVIVYPPGGTFATSKLPFNTPPYEGSARSAEIEQEGVDTGDPDSLQGLPMSNRENPEPQTCTSVFTCDDVSLSISGFNLTLKSKSPTEFVRIVLSG